MGTFQSSSPLTRRCVQFLLTVPMLPVLDANFLHQVRKYIESMAEREGIEL